MTALRLRVAMSLLVCVLATLSAPVLAARPIDQAGWAERKRQVTLPNGTRLAYVELGDPAGPPLLLLHGYTDTSRVWTMLAPQLQRHRILIPDQRGHGASDAPACCYALAHFVDDARLFLDAMGIERAAIAGHSLGSLVAMQLAADHPDRVDRLVLIGSTALVPVRRGDPFWALIMGLRAPIDSNHEFLRQWSPSASPTPVDPALARSIDAEIRAVPPHVWRAVIRELADLPAGRHAADIRAPVLILSGGRDEIFPAEHHAALVAAFPNAEAHVFADLGHNLVYERPEQVGPVLARFLEGSWPGPSAAD
ncbi:alpha/beta fold hydrolase [Sphingosinicella terrae]|uniref:alpha/beta fold hydrolase n=1 Tax=Sphingosinicella terrae TaxID=2172047 RepID=UPI000E0D8B9A|nr:alpha/beta hydrolase [Sphingosinicella terrae]